MNNNNQETHRISEQLQTIIHLLNHVLNNQQKQMATLTDLQTAVAAEDSVIASVEALLTGLSAQIAALQPNSDAIAALAADVANQTASLTSAITANTPVSPSQATATS